MRPPLLLADEPTGSLDPATGERIMDLMLGLNAEQGTTLILVTHDPALAKRCQRTLRLESGANFPVTLELAPYSPEIKCLLAAQNAEAIAREVRGGDRRWVVGRRRSSSHSVLRGLDPPAGQKPLRRGGGLGIHEYKRGVARGRGWPGQARP